ncbi:MAG: 4Fe-4S binding protein, partial [Euryarchaeota archaeon]|nr:4Fe-4S binding protein [Euryarchaeota archaeon]
MENAMPGIPEHLLISGVVLILVLTFGVVEYLERRRVPSERLRYDLLRFAPLRRVMESRLFQPVLQIPVVALFFLIIAAGLIGEQRPDRNIATVLTWVVWWALIVFAIALVGKVWCTLCPWNAVSDWIRRRSLWRRVRDERLFTLNLKWPSRLKNIYLATLLFLLLTWLELGLGVTSSPRITAYLGLLILSMAIVPAVLFEGKPFCRYACLVGRISGLYAMFSPVELRSRSKRVCRSCRTKDCHRGNERGYPCPTFERLDTMDSNTYCILCTECVKSCRHGNVSLNLRPPAADLL